VAQQHYLDFFSHWISALNLLYACRAQNILLKIQWKNWIKYLLISNYAWLMSTPDLLIPLELISFNTGTM